jgi:serine/threonine protein kinase
VGTADYLSPEHIGSPGKLSAASDIYSLGCTLYYAVTGKVPFPGGTTRDKARRHCEEIPLNPRRFNLELTDEFIDVIAAMMEKDPEKRIQTGDEVVRRLAPWAADSVKTAVGEAGTAAGQGPLRPMTPDQADTQPGWFDDVDGLDEDSPSQVSQRTDPVASAEHETLPDIGRSTGPVAPEPDFPLTLTVLVLGPLLIAAGVLLASVAIKALL